MNKIMKKREEIFTEALAIGVATGAWVYNVQGPRS